MTAFIRATHEDSDGAGHCRGCGTTIGEPHHPGCERARPTKHVRLRLQAGGYSATLDVRAVSDTTEIGWYAIENAIAEAFEDLPCRDRPADEHNTTAGTVSVACVELTNAAGDRKIVEDTDLRREEWLKDLVTAAEIVA